MKPWRGSIQAGVLLAVWFLCACPTRGMADEVLMLNGDRLTGQVVGFTNSTFLMTNDTLGILRLPRSQVRQIHFGSGPSSQANLPNPPTSPSPSEVPSVPQGSLAGLGSQTNLIQSVLDQFLRDATPEAQAKFNELLTGLLSGKLNKNDIRTEARSAAAQLRAARKDLGNDAGFAIDSYLAILDRFVGTEVDQKSEHKKSGK